MNDAPIDKKIKELEKFLTNSTDEIFSVHRDDVKDALLDIAQYQRELCAEAWLKYTFSDDLNKRRKVSLTYKEILKAGTEE